MQYDVQFSELAEKQYDKVKGRDDYDDLENEAPAF